MDSETLQALIKVYRARASTDLLSIIMDEAEGPQAQAAVLELLHSLSPESLADNEFAPVRRKACHFCLAAEDYDLADRIARASELPEDRVLRARALHGLSREQEAAALYRQAILQDPAIRNRDIERLFGICPSPNITPSPAKIIPLSTYSSRRENKTEQDRRDFGRRFYRRFRRRGCNVRRCRRARRYKREICRRIVLPYLKPSLFDRYKQKAGGNILLYGPPGCGKTLIARATAGESDARFLTVNPEDIIDRYTGEAEKRLHVLFDEARSDTPSILFFDDFDVLAFRRAGLPPEAAPALVAAFASELDGTQNNNGGVLTIMATNAPWALDHALFRAGRFQRRFFVPPPPLEARKRILMEAVSNIPGADKVAFDRIALKSAGFSGADLRALADWVSNASLTKALAGASDAGLTTALFEEGLKLFGPSTPNWLSLAKAEMKPIHRHEALGRLFFPLYRA